MSSVNPTSCQVVAPSAACKASILRVWDIVNRHFESLLATAERSATKSRAEVNIMSQVKELQDLMGMCTRRLKTVEAYISELQKQEMGALTNNNNNNLISREPPCSELAGEWHFLYMENNRVFAYMKLVPETVSIGNIDHHGGTGRAAAVRRGEFTIPSGVLTEANDTSEDHGDDDDDDDDSTERGHCCNYVLCPCCEISFKASVFWKHALFEIAGRGNRVPAWQTLDRSAMPRWIVDKSAGWSDPIYRPRRLERTCEIGQSLAELNLKHFLWDYDFSRALDSTFESLALQLRP